MTVGSEVSYAERAWTTGNETDFAPGMVAQSASHITLAYRDAAGVITALTAGVHITVSKTGDEGFTGAISATPIAGHMPPVPGTVIIERVTPALQSTDFQNLEDFDPNIHTRLHDAAALRAAELRNRQARVVAPWSIVTTDVVDFRPRRAQVADPIDDADVATKLWVLTVTGILNLTALVAAAAASAAAAAASVVLALAAKVASEAARDKAQLWSDQAEDTIVQGAEYSAYHWSRKAVAAAATILPYLSAIDYGFVSDAPSATRDYGSVL